MRARFTAALPFVAFLAVASCRPPVTEIEDSELPIDTVDAGPNTRAEPPVVVPVARIEVETLAGSSTSGSTEGARLAATFDNPVGVLLDPAGGLIVTEYDGGRVRRVPTNGATSTLVRGLIEPFAILLTQEALFVQTDRDQSGDKGPSSGTIWRQDLAGGEPTVFLEGLGRPRGMARLFDGRVVISDRDRNRLSILNLATRAVTPLAGSSSPGFRDGVGTSARFREPYGVAVLPDGNILVADHSNHVIRKVTLAGAVSVYAGDGNPGMRDDADKLNARFDGPIDIAIDVAGNAFVSDGGNHRIRRITSAGSVDTVAGDGIRGFTDGEGTAARFYGQEQLEVTPDGKTIYVTDGNGGDGAPYHRIRTIHVP